MLKSTCVCQSLPAGWVLGFGDDGGMMFEDQFGVIKDLGNEGKSSVNSFIRAVLAVTKGVFAAIYFDIVATSRGKVFDDGLEGIQAEKVSKIFSDAIRTVTAGFGKGAP